jgi:Flp pilus assembly pilin Flp
MLHRLRRHLRLRLRRSDAGQATAEYGLVILVACTLALAALVWARESGAIGDLFDTVIERLTSSM